MIKILQNTTGSPITMGSDVGNVIIPVLPATYTIPPQDYLLWAASSSIIAYLNDGPTPSIIVNDGVDDLNPSDGMDLIKGNFPNFFVKEPSSDPITTNVAPNVEDSHTFPSGTRLVTITNRGNYLVKYAYAPGESSTKPIFLWPNAPRCISQGVKISEDPLTIYYQSNGVSQPIEAEIWK